jgi:hypothetical protein
MMIKHMHVKPPIETIAPTNVKPPIEMIRHMNVKPPIEIIAPMNVKPPIEMIPPLDSKRNLEEVAKEEFYRELITNFLNSRELYHTMQCLKPNGSKVRLTVSVDDIRKFNQQLYDMVWSSPYKY